MMKPSQQLIDLCLTIINDDMLNKKDMRILGQQLKERGLFYDIDFSNAELMDTLILLIGAKRFDNIDLSDIDLPYTEYMSGDILNSQTIIESWTTNVKWPSKMSFDPKQILQESKRPSEMTLVHKQATGKDIGIAIIDATLNLDHPEYSDNIKYYEKVGFWPQQHKEPDYHSSLVVGCACGKTTGTAPNADLYYIAANNWPLQTGNSFAKATEKTFKEPLTQGHRYNYIIAIKRILEINKRLPENKKIRFLSCSWGSGNDQLRKECDELFAECEKNGIMVLGGFYNLISSNTTRQFDKRFPNTTGKTGIPTDGKTTPYYKGGYIYKRSGGASSTFPYIAGVFACACQDNQIFFTRTNWQTELYDILNDTAITAPNGGKMINPMGIRERVSEIAREMEMKLIKQSGIQHE